VPNRNPNWRTDMTAKRPVSERQKRHAALLKEALSRPGVAEYMEVYQNWQRCDRGIDSYREAMKGMRKTSTTNHFNTSDLLG